MGATVIDTVRLIHMRVDPDWRSQLSTPPSVELDQAKSAVEEAGFGDVLSELASGMARSADGPVAIARGLTSASTSWAIAALALREQGVDEGEALARTAGAALDTFGAGMAVAASLAPSSGLAIAALISRALGPVANIVIEGAVTEQHLGREIAHASLSHLEQPTAPPGGQSTTPPVEISAVAHRETSAHLDEIPADSWPRALQSNVLASAVTHGASLVLSNLKPSREAPDAAAPGHPNTLAPADSTTEDESIGAERSELPRRA